MAFDDKMKRESMRKLMLIARINPFTNPVFTAATPYDWGN
jgi:hypothetical protein